MKILHYIPSIDKNSGGIGVYMQTLARDLGKLCDLHVVTHPSDNKLPLENCTIHYMPYKWLPWSNCRKEFINILEDVSPDIFHTNSCWMPVSALTAIWADKWRRNSSLTSPDALKLVYTPHGMLEPYSIHRHFLWKKLPAMRIFQRKGIAVCNYIHATADMERENLLKLGWNKDVTVIPNCIQTDNVLVKTSWKRTNNILFLSRIHPKKGVNFLIEAVAELKTKLSGFTVIIAGTGEMSYINKMVSLTQKLGVDHMIRFIGPVYGKDKWRLYQQADLFVLPTYSENFGIVVPESLASGTPVITTCGTPWNELNSLHCGWRIEIGAKSLVEALEKFLACTEDELETMGRNGMSLVNRKYTSQIVTRQFLDFYTSL